MSRKRTRPTATHIPKPSLPWPPLKAPAQWIVSAAIEAEVAQLGDAEEKREYLETLGLSEAGLDRVICAGYSLLDLITFFTSAEGKPRLDRRGGHHRCTRGR